MPIWLGLLSLKKIFALLSKSLKKKLYNVMWYIYMSQGDWNLMPDEISEVFMTSGMMKNSEVLMK